MTDSQVPSDKEQQASAVRPGISDEQVMAYTSADPFAMTSTKPWEYEARSPFLRKVAIIWIILVMAAHLFMGFTVGLSFTGATVTTIDKFAFPGVGVVISILSWIALTRPRLRANSDGVEAVSYTHLRAHET